MNWKFNGDKPIYVQLVERITHAVVMGEYAPGSKMPGVREFAAEAGVNPNTMQRALAELETKGLLYAQRTNGRFVTEDEAFIKQLRAQLASETTIEYIGNMNSLGYPVSEISAFVETHTQ